ncbi:MAG: OB-fold nucleic acid binding domain-containing protein [Candidatus Bathyarchaeota archaeon]|nr:OB-fold nucleic acid binding domain-containing protein [Candidatus Bathyarchaeota archaeon]
MRVRVSRDRVHPRGRHHKLADFSALEYIDRISMKYGLDLNIFFDSFVEAWRNQKSSCEGLSIECREKTRDYAIFLITQGLNVVAQFRISNHMLQATNPLKNFVSAKNLMTKIPAKVKVENPFIKDLKIGMKIISLIGKVTEISKLNTVFSRNGDANTVANAKLTDDTGFIQLSLWNQQIQTVAIGDVIQIENASVVSYRGKLQLRIHRGGQLKVIKKGEPLKRPYM